MRQFVVRYSLLLVVLLIVSACGQASAPASGPTVVDSPTEESPPASTTDEPPTVALVMKTLTNPFFVEMEKGARRAEQELGITLVVRTGAQETSIEQQISIIKELIEDQVDAIVIAPADSKELIPVLKEAQDAGIVLINVDNRLDPEISASLGLTDVPFISVDNEQGAYLSAQYISEQITEPTEAVILEGIRSADNAEQRKQGAMRAFGENANITVVAEETANWKIDEAYDVTGQLFEEHPNIKAMFCANDMMAFGALQYLKEQNRTDVMVTAYDALEEARAFIRDGELQATIDQQAAEQAYLGVKYAVDAINGEDIPAETMVDVLLVTSDNVDE
ncbi:MAG: sugar ABC transporter substrate-binding protein [Chloroflexaceae bacterium]|nr:sugar ABC transporter substrate-binding protein [Chloroflexaceae bacterium]